jgi:hypothetical protein
VGYQLVLFSQLLGAAGSMYGIFEQYKRLTGNATRFVELLEELDKISGQKCPRYFFLKHLSVLSNDQLRVRHHPTAR